MMSDNNDAPKPDTPPDSEPNSDADDGDKTAPEEVEAELVNEDEAPEPADIKVAPADKSDSAESDEAPREESIPKFASGLSPGVVIFLAFAVAVAVIIIIWRFEIPATKLPAEPAATQATETTPEPPAASAEAATQPPAPPAEETSPDKVSNEAAAAEAKEAATAITPTEEEIAASPGLPPPPPPGATEGNEALQSAAKEAQRLYGPEAGTANEAADESSTAQDTEDISEPSFDTGAEASGRETEESAAAEDTLAYGADGGGALAGIADPKLANELAALKEAFRAETESLSSALEEERRRGERQSAEIAALREEIGKIRTGSTAPASRRAAAALALISLQRAIDSGGPYKDQFEVLERLAPNLPAVERLRARAETGTPTAASLGKRFSEAARRAVAASDRARAKGPFGRLMANLQGLIGARPARPQAGGSDRAVISRAEARLAANDLAGALSELDALDAPAKEAMGPWLADARARAAAAQAIDDLNGLLLNALQD